jgi:hypothetical protein
VVDRCEASLYVRFTTALSNVSPQCLHW